MKTDLPIVTMLSLALLFLSGCSANQLQYGNFCQIHVGTSTKETVRQLLGPPNAELDEQWMYEKPHRHLHAFVEFDQQDLVSRIQWIEAENDIWEDSADHKMPSVDSHEPLSAG